MMAVERDSSEDGFHAYTRRQPMYDQDKARWKRGFVCCHFGSPVPQSVTHPFSRNFSFSSV